MKKEQLRKIIKEEIQNVLSEMPVAGLNMLVGAETEMGNSRKIYQDSLMKMIKKISEHLKAGEERGAQGLTRRKQDVTFERGDIYFGLTNEEPYKTDVSAKGGLHVASNNISNLIDVLDQGAKDEPGLSGLVNGLKKTEVEDFALEPVTGGFLLTHPDISTTMPVDILTLQEWLVQAYQDSLTEAARYANSVDVEKKAAAHEKGEFPPADEADKERVRKALDWKPVDIDQN